MRWVLHLGINWAGLFYASWLLLWLSIGAGASYVILMAGLNFVATLRRQADSGNFPGTSKAYAHAQRAKRQVNEWAPRIALFVVGYVLGQVSIFSPVRELHMVEVLGKHADRVYSIAIPANVNPAFVHDTVMTIRLCTQGDDLPLVKDMVIEPFQYIQENDCLLIDQRTTVDWLRDREHNVIDKSGKILFAKESVQ